jgi:hypothetical protein
VALEELPDTDTYFMRIAMAVRERANCTGNRADRARRARPLRRDPRNSIGEEWHFYNRVAGKVYDMTSSQFEAPPPYLDVPPNRDEALAGTTPEHYKALAGRVVALEQ